MKIRDDRSFNNECKFGDLPNGSPFLYTEVGSVTMLAIKAEVIPTSTGKTNVTSLKDGKHYYLSDNIRVVSLESSMFILKD